MAQGASGGQDSGQTVGARWGGEPPRAILTLKHGGGYVGGRVELFLKPLKVPRVPLIFCWYKAQIAAGAVAKSG